MMDKLKKVLDFFKINLFWFISASTIIAVVIFWWWSTGTLADDYKKQETIIKNKINQVDAIVKDAELHPTPEYIKAVGDKHIKLKEGVLQVWSTLYNEQKNKNPWPKEVLGEYFINGISKLGPDEYIPEDLRAIYQERIREYFTNLTKIIDLRQSEAGLVDWDENNQKTLRDRLRWPRTPTTLQVKLTQEDLWVYETLLRVIRETNAGAAERSQATVKQIEWIKIAGSAFKAWSEAEQNVFQTPSSESSARSAPAQSETKNALGAGTDGNEILMKNRYVDDKGAPLDADAQQPYAEFKMMPISMKLVMNQTKISKLLVECVNRSMPIEIQRVRIRPGQGEILVDGVLRSGQASGDDKGDGSGATGGRPTRPGAEASSEVVESDPFDVPVEIQGVIYIYNPPDLNLLGTGTALEKPAEAAPAAASGAAPPSEPGTPAASPEGVAP